MQIRNILLPNVLSNCIVYKHNKLQKEMNLANKDSTKL